MPSLTDAIQRLATRLTPGDNIEDENGSAAVDASQDQAAAEFQVRRASPVCDTSSGTITPSSEPADSLISEPSNALNLEQLPTPSRAPEYLTKGLRCFWNHVIAAEATASRIADERARVRGRSAPTLENIFEIFRQLTPEIDLVCNNFGSAENNSQRLSKRSRVNNADEVDRSQQKSDPDGSVAIKSDSDISPPAWRRENSPEIVSLFEGRPLTLKWRVETFRSDGTECVQNESDSQQMRSRWCHNGGRQLLRADWATKLWNFDRLLVRHNPLMRRKLEVYQHGLAEVDLSTPIDSILKCVVCPICFRTFRDSRLFQDDLLQLSLNPDNETSEIVVPQCGHLLCKDCFKTIESRSSSASSRGKACPSCRHKIKHAYTLKWS